MRKMKSLLLSLGILIFSNIMVVKAQVEPDSLLSGLTVHSAKDFSISASPDILFSTPNGRVFSGGLKIRAFAGKRFSFDSDILLGKNFMQIGPGIIGIPALLFSNGLGFGTDEGDQSFQEFLIMSAFILLSAEHFAYHIPIKNYTDISPYVSLLRFRQFTNVPGSQNTDGVEGSACFAAGLEINKYINRFMLSPYIDYSTAYSGAFRGFTCGVNFGYYVSNK
jgi:hypothetical protein